MTKADLINQIHEQVGLSKKEASDMVETLFQTIKETLALGESIKLSGFGTFVVRNKGSRRGRNPKTGVEIEIQPRRVVTFKPSVQFKEQVEHSVPIPGESSDIEASESGRETLV